MSPSLSWTHAKVLVFSIFTIKGTLFMPLYTKGQFSCNSLIIDNIWHKLSVMLIIIIIIFIIIIIISSSSSSISITIIIIIIVVVVIITTTYRQPSPALRVMQRKASKKSQSSADTCTQHSAPTAYRVKRYILYLAGSYSIHTVYSPRTMAQVLSCFLLVISYKWGPHFGVICIKI